ncbi:MAG: hypothetical protein NTZ48_06335, partial [Candidatus Omnitrophica bacterium]|nr:hypothetical protein [Candidatus Omnitrophota bacterium]
MKFIKKTSSLCPVCLEIIDAEVLEENRNVYLSKRCYKHGLFFSKHIWSSGNVYMQMLTLPIEELSFANGLVLNLTNDCNLNCPFCYSRANDVKYT